MFAAVTCHEYTLTFFTINSPNEKYIIMVIKVKPYKNQVHVLYRYNIIMIIILNLILLLYYMLLVH